MAAACGPRSVKIDDDVDANYSIKYSLNAEIIAGVSYFKLLVVSE